MSSPKHSPPPSAAAPKPKGILKNASSSNSIPQRNNFNNDTITNNAGNTVEEQNRLAWDESNLTLHEIEREQQDPRMKIDEPKTPFVRSSSLGPMDEDGGLFDLDNNQATGSNQKQFSSPSNAADVLAANTKANAIAIAESNNNNNNNNNNNHSSISMSRGSTPSSSKKGGDSRSPSFTLPNSRRSSSTTGDRSREGVRQEMKNRENEENEEDTFADDNDPELDPETKAKHDAFARKRNAHYGNEAEAMKIAAALASKDEDEEDEEDDQMHQDNVLPPLPNGRS